MSRPQRKTLPPICLSAVVAPIGDELRAYVFVGDEELNARAEFGESGRRSIKYVPIVRPPPNVDISLPSCGPIGLIDADEHGRIPLVCVGADHSSDRRISIAIFEIGGKLAGLHSDINSHGKILGRSSHAILPF